MATLEKTNNKIVIDTKILPEEERKFLVDFLEFLAKKRSEKKSWRKSQNRK